MSILVKDLKFLSAIEEPYYCSLCLYDVKDRSKLCETFHFELNDGEFFSLFKKGTSIFCSVNRCLIPLGLHNRNDTFIVVRIDKLYSIDIEKDFSKYQKKPVCTNFIFSLFQFFLIFFSFRVKNQVLVLLLGMLGMKWDLFDNLLFGLLFLYMMKVQK